ncbi:MAG: hypothetical protein ACOX2Y_02955 [Christensenellales bacterium]
MTGICIQAKRVSKTVSAETGSAYFGVSARGCRPCPTYTRRRWESSSAGTYYVNKFSNGEVWVSTSYNSRTGTRISTASEDIKYLFVMLVGPGGGGGGVTEQKQAVAAEVVHLPTFAIDL